MIDWALQQAFSPSDAGFMIVLFVAWALGWIEIGKRTDKERHNVQS
jgi:hypothetical protein